MAFVLFRLVAAQPLFRLRVFLKIPRTSKEGGDISPVRPQGKDLQQIVRVLLINLFAVIEGAGSWKMLIIIKILAGLGKLLNFLLLIWEISWDEFLLGCLRGLTL
jgi:hypothetical protein